ncbi:hypothetical protein [Chitinophaga sp.]|uniref:hypothetical protein n=1 Tax=Chitinophaga sp. TaxID=1869181 RepID=UPI002F95A2D0
MKYRNPLALLEKMNGAAIDATDTAAVSLLRKKILAELELTADKVLVINGEGLSKNDLLLFFDSLKNKTELHFHEEIKSDPVLSEFLVTGSINGLFADKALYKDKSFLSFIAPFYEPLFTTAVLSSLQQQQVETLQYLFANPVLLDGASMKRCYDKIFRLLKQQYTVVEDVRKKLANDYWTRWQQVANYIGPTQVQLLNALPDAFHLQRSDYGILLINFALALHANGHKKEALKILVDLQQLKSISYVQENVEKYIPYVKGEIPNRPQSVKTATTVTPFGFRGLTKAGLIQIGLIIIVVMAIVSGVLSDIKPSVDPSIIPVKKNIFSGSRTDRTMSYLLSQLQITPSAPVDSLLKYPAITPPATGDDLYGPAFMQALRKQGAVGRDFIKPRYNSQELVVPEYGDWPDIHHRQSICLYNRQETALIALVQTPDSFYSCYVSAYDSAFLPLPLSLSRVYFCLGDSWNPDLLGYWAMEYVPSYTVKGLFMHPVYNHDVFLHKSAIQFVLDSTYWKTSNRYIPLEISHSDQQQLQLKPLLDNSNGVEMIVGE